MAMMKMSKKLDYTLKALLALAMLAGSVVGFTLYYYDAPGPLSEEKTVILKHGSGFEGSVETLTLEHVIRYPFMFKALAFIVGDARKFKAGEYDFSATITPKLVMDMVAQGRVVIHKITVPEGFSVHDVQGLMDKEPLLDGALPQGIPEGSLLPETYHFTYGDERSMLIERMRTGMKQTLDELWAKRKADLPFKTQQEALTMASIVEKETGLTAERGHVASVFINRIRKGIKLQSDPTVAYGLNKENGHGLTLTDLRSETAYNTYVIDGLPPGPICNPGRASLEAVLNPPDTNDLYFVATGTGGHNFAATLQQHNANVAAYRRVMARK